MAKDAAYQEALKKIQQAQQSNAISLDLSPGLFANQKEKLTELPPEIAQLTNLHTLSLSNNQLTELPEVIAQLTNLQRLYLHSNQLTALPEVIAQLTNLQILLLYNNKLTELPEVIAQLTNLPRLDLSNNKLTALPEAIAQLTNLRELNLRNNQLTALPEAIAQLTNLRELNLDNNQLKELPEVIAQLTNLQWLSLRRNQLTVLPREFSILTDIWHFDISQNNLPIPWDVFRGGKKTKALWHYYIDCLEQGSQLLDEAKVILVGQGTVGKTSLVKRLCEEGFDPSETKTDGIAIRNIELNLSPQSQHDHIVQLNIWDFGGQEIMHATHQFFLTNRSLYLLLINNRNTEEENRLEYWLNTIESFAADSPVIVVGNKSDEHPMDLNEKDLKQKYPNIKAFIPISCKKNSRIKGLLQKIRKEIKALDHVGNVLPKRWFDVKRKLESLDKNYIPYEEYADICSENAITDDEKQKTLVSLLHDLGIVLNFHNDPNVSDTHVINPEWLTAGIYCIINYPALTTQHKGILSYSLLARILPKKLYPTHKHKFIIAMMKKFELCFRLDEDTILIPNLLPKSAPESLDESQWQDSLKFEYHYPILSQSVISRFIVKMHHRIKDKIWWRTGVVLSYGQNSALIKADLYDKKIFISVNGTPSTRRDFLAEIRGCFAYINNNFSKKSRPDHRIPLLNHPRITTSYKYLLTLEREGVEKHIFEGTEEPENVSELLSGIKRIASDQETFDKIQSKMMHFHGETSISMPDIQQTHSGSGDNVAGDKTVNYNYTQNLAQAARDIKKLIEQLQGDYDSTPVGNMQMGAEIVTRIDSNPTLKSRAVNALKEAGVEAFKQAVSHPAAAIVIAGIEGFTTAE